MGNRGDLHLRSVCVMRWCVESTACPFLSKATVKSILRKNAALAALAAAFALQTPLSGTALAETRTISLFMVHTKEEVTVTYKKDGKYIPDAMKKINHILRDWRRNESTRMDPKVVDLMWELHADLGSKKPVHIISGYRSPRTNALLKRIGRKVARRSQHIAGRAIDLYFPDVPISRLRGSAFVRRIGGVGYYPRSGKHGFIHIDTGRVRHWPRIGAAKMASIMRSYRSTVGQRFRRPASTTLIAQAKPAETKPATTVASTTRSDRIVPRPRPRPLEVLLLAAAKLTVTPASAPVPKRNFGTRATIAAGESLGQVASAGALTSEPVQQQLSNTSRKGSLQASLLAGNANDTPMIKPLTETVAFDEHGNSNVTVTGSFGDIEAAVRRDGAPRSFSSGQSPIAAEQTGIQITSENNSDLTQVIVNLTKSEQVTRQMSATSGKADRQEVNSGAKGDLWSSMSISNQRRLTGTAGNGVRFAQQRRSQDDLQRDEEPLTFK